MAKRAYCVAAVDLADRGRCKEVIASSEAAFDKDGRSFGDRGGRYQLMGRPGANRVAVIEFKRYETTLACSNFPDYRKAAGTRVDCAEARQASVDGV